MWTKIREIAGRYFAKSAADTGTLFVVREEAELVLPPVDLSLGVQYFVLPLGQARITMSGADAETKINAGNGPRDRETFGGQQIITLVPLDTWRAVGYPTPENLDDVVTPTVEHAPEQAAELPPQRKPEPKTKARK